MACPFVYINILDLNLHRVCLSYNTTCFYRSKYFLELCLRLLVWVSGTQLLEVVILVLALCKQGHTCVIQCLQISVFSILYVLVPDPSLEMTATLDGGAVIDNRVVPGLVKDLNNIFHVS